MLSSHLVGISRISIHLQMRWADSAHSVSTRRMTRLAFPPVTPVYPCMIHPDSMVACKSCQVAPKNHIEATQLESLNPFPILCTRCDSLRPQLLRHSQLLLLGRLFRPLPEQPFLTPYASCHKRKLVVCCCFSVFVLAILCSGCHSNVPPRLAANNELLCH